MDRYYVYLNERVQGPLELNEVYKLEGFNDELLLCKEGTEEWVFAKAIPEIPKLNNNKFTLKKYIKIGVYILLTIAVFILGSILLFNNIEPSDNSISPVIKKDKPLERIIKLKEVKTEKKIIKDKKPANKINSDFLRADGKKVVDKNNNNFLFKGMGLGNWLMTEGYMWNFGEPADRPRKIEKVIEKLLGNKKAKVFWKKYRDNFITENDIRKIAELGFNSVRPALNYRLFIDEKGDTYTFKNDGFYYLDRLANWCRKYNIYIVLDMHAAPGGQTGADHDDSLNDYPDLFKYTKYQDMTVDLWRKIAEHYHSDTIIAAYDLLNEPLPGHFRQYKYQLVPLYKKITKAIREVDKNHIITVEGANWGNDWYIFSSTPFDDNLLYQFHKYWDIPDERSIRIYLIDRDLSNSPIWVGETGEGDNDWYWINFQLLKDYNIGWSFWTWKKMPGSNSPYLIKQPKEWQKIIDYTEGKNKVSFLEAEKILNELLNKIKIENCEYNPDVINAIFRRIPAKIQAENYGHKGEGVSYHVEDTTVRSANYRYFEPVNIIKAGENYNIGWMENGEWLQYDVYCDVSNNYNIYLRMAAPSKNTSFRIEINGRDIAGDVLVKRTGAWDKWDIISIKNIYLRRGKQSIKFICTTGGYNLDWITINTPYSKRIPDRPENLEMYRGKTGRIPGKIESEQYSSYYDNDAENNGGAFRKDDGVDIQKLTKTFAVKLKEGEWVNYEINNLQDQIYKIRMRVEGSKIGTELNIIFDDKPLKHTLKIKDKEWHIIDAAYIHIPHGRHHITLKAEKNPVKIDWFSIEKE